ncbi:MAG TPA: RMD1 family protein [Kofleriaceae bacterium]|nr:RMD1 family protein [Kofleriaceae bacterium]
MTDDRARDVAARLGTRFEARAIHVGEHIDVRGVEPRLGTQLPVMIEVAPAGYAALLRAGVAVVFGVDPIQQERFIADLGPRVSDKYAKLELERAIVKLGDADAVEPDALVIKELTLERLQVIAVILGKSVILARYEQEIAEVFQAIEPMAVEMTGSPDRLPWKQRDLVRHIGGAMLVQHQLVGAAEVLEKPDLLWENPELDRMYARLEDEYEIRERHLALERKLAVVSTSAGTMLELAQAKRSINVEYYIVGLIVLEIALALYQILAH